MRKSLARGFNQLNKKMLLVAAIAAVGFVAQIPVAHGALITGTWNSNTSGTNWTVGFTGGTPGTGTGSPTGSGDTANLTFNISGNRTVNLDANETIGTLNIGDTDNTNSYTLSGANTLTMDNTSGVGNASINQTSTSKGDTISVNLALKGSTDITNASANAFTLNTGTLVSSASTGTQTLTFKATGAGAINVSDNISNGGSGGTIAVTVNSAGAGITTLSGTDAYTGATTVNAGALTVTGTLSGTTSIAANNGGTFLIDMSGSGAANPSNFVNTAATLTLGGGTLNLKGKATGTNTQQLGNLSLTTNTSSSIVVNKNAGSGSTTLTLGNTWTHGANSGLFVDLSSGGVLASNPSAQLTANNIIPWLAVKDATATGFGTISGSNIVRAGTTAWTSDVALSSSTIYSVNTAFTVTANRTMDALEIDNPASNLTQLTVNNGVTLSFTDGAIVANLTNSFVIGGGSGGGQIGASNANLSVNVIAGTLRLGANNSNYTALVSGGTGSLTKLGAGTLLLNGNQTFTGDTIIAGGTLQLGENTTGGVGNLNSTNVVIATGATLALNGQASRTFGNVGGTTVISGGGNIQVSSTGTWTFIDANTYDGTTTVINGTLAIKNNAALGSAVGGTIVNTGRSLALDGSGGALTITGEALNLSGTGAAFGAMVNTAGDNTWTGLITLGAGSTIYSVANSLTITGGIKGAFVLTVDGPSTTIFASADTNTGLIKNGTGTLQINSLTATLGGQPITHNLGTISIDNVGATGATSVTAGTFTFGGDGAVLQTKQTAAQNVLFTVSSVARTAAMTGYVNNANAGTLGATNGIVVTGAVGVVDQGVFLGASSASATDFAYADNTSQFLRAANYGTDAGTAAISSTVGDLSGNKEYLISAGGNVTGATSQAIKTLKFTGGGTLTLGSGATLTLNTPGFLVTGGNSSTISGGTALTPASNKEIVVRTDSSSDTLIINTAITGSSGGLTKTGAGSLTLGNTTYTGTLTVNAGTVNLNGSGTQSNTTVNGSSALNLGLASAVNAGTLTLNGTSTMTQSVDNAISGGTAVTFNSPTTFTLSNANSYSGLTTVNAGVTLVIGNNLALGTSAGTTSITNATIQLQGNLTNFAETINIQNGTGTIQNLSGTNTFTGNIGWSGGGGNTNTITSVAGKLIIGGTIIGINTGGGSPGGNLTGSGDFEISGSGDINNNVNTIGKSGSGTLFIKKATNFAGSLTISGGVVNLTNASGLGTGSVSGGITAGASLVLQLAGSNTLTNTIGTINGAGVGGNGAIRNVSGDTTLTSGFGWSGGGVVNATRIQVDSGSLTLKGILSVNSHNDLTIGGAANTTISGAFTDQTQSYNIFKTDPGTLFLTGASTITGGNVNLIAGTMATYAGPGLSDAGATTSGASTTMTVTDSSKLFVGENVTGTNFGTPFITKIVDGTHITLSAATTGTASSVVFSAWSSFKNANNPLAVTNGNFTLQGANSGTSAETMAGFTLNAGAATIAIDPNGGTSTTLTLGNAWTRNAGGTLLIDYSSANLGTRQVTTAAATTGVTLSNGIYGWALVTDSSGVTGFATRAAGSNIAITRYDDTTGSTLANNTNTAGTNYTTLNTTYTGGTLSWSSAITTRSVNSLTIDTTNNGGTIDMGASGNILTLTSLGILFKGANNEILTGGQVGAANSEVIIHQTGSGLLTVNSPISSGTGRLTVDGTGVTVLGGTNVYTGNTNINGGVLRVAVDGTNLPTNSLLNLNNGVYETSASTFTRTLGSAAGNVQVIAGNSGFSANGGSGLTVTLGGGTITWGTASFNPTSLILNASTANNTLTFTNNVDLNDSVRTVNVNANTASMSGVISSTGISGGLIKGGAGNLALTNTNTYVGPTSILGGKLTLSSTGVINTSSGITINGTGAAFITNSSTAVTAPITFTKGTIGGSGTISAVGGVSAGANTFISPGNSPSTQTYTTGLTLSSGSTYIWEHNAGNAIGTVGTNYDQLISGGSGVIAVSGGSLSLNFAGTTDFTNSFWDSSHAWTIILASGGTVTGAFTSGNISLNGSAASYVNNSNAVAGQGSFTTALTGGSEVLTWTPSTLNPIYTLGISSSSGRILTSGSATVTTTITNTNQAFGDSIHYTGLGATPNTNLTGAATSGGPLNADGSSNSNVQTFSGASAGSYTLTAAGTPTGDNGTTPSLSGSAGTTTINVVNQRSFTAPTIALGRFLASGTPTGSSAITSSGLNNVTANATLGSFSGTNTGSLTLTTGDSTVFNGGSATQTATYTIGGTTTAGALVGASFSAPVTAELGSISNVVVNVTGNALNLRTLSGPSTLDLGNLLKGATVTVSSNRTVSSTGLYADTTSVQLNSIASGTDANGLSLTGSAYGFTGGTLNDSTTRTLSGTLDTSSYGTKSNSFSNTATTLETGLGDTYSPVTIAYTANIGNAIATRGVNRADFSQSTALSAVVGVGDSYAGLASHVVGYLNSTLTGTPNGPTPEIGSEAIIRAGASSQGNTVTMQWRLRQNSEVTTGNGTLLPKGDQLIADVVSITGMELTGGAADDSLHNGLGLVKKTDVYTLQMSYSDAGMGSMEAVYAATGKIQLVYLNPGADNAYGTSDDQWQNAVVGNFGSPGTDAYVNYQGSWDNFVLYEDNLHGVNFVENNLGLFLSSWGVDTANNDVWAVLNHNSQFSVVPEPASLGLLALGSVGLLSRRRRRVA